MDEEKQPDKKDFRNQAIKQGARKLMAKNKKGINAWWGFSLFGLVGWTVIIPTLIGIFIGIWLSRYNKEFHSWTLMLLLTGIFVGCMLALILLGREMFKNEDE